MVIFNSHYPGHDILKISHDNLINLTNTYKNITIFFIFHGFIEMK